MTAIKPQLGRGKCGHLQTNGGSIGDGATPH